MLQQRYLVQHITREIDTIASYCKTRLALNEISNIVRPFEHCSRRSSSSVASVRQNVVSHKVDEPRRRKKKVALMLGFNGSPYQGMQINPNAHTIEGVLFKALCAAGAVSKSNAVDSKKVQLQRAARTDKGVHAACNVVSLKLIGFEDKQLIEKINDALSPEPIRVWGFVEVQRSFNAKNSCGSRIYEYMLPSYALTCLNPIRTWNTALCDMAAQPLASKSDYISVSSSCEENNSQPTTAKYIKLTDAEQLSRYRVNAERLERFKEAISLYKGTHNFHNYTNSKSFEDQSANRHIISVEVSEPKVIKDIEWLSVKLHGNSFMIHQIRKMIAMAVLCVRTNSPLEIIPKSFESTKINIPKAPSSGLLLDRPDFMAYNKKIVLQQKEGTTSKGTLTFDAYQSEIEAFKKHFIYPHIVETETRERLFDSFLATVEPHLEANYGYFLSARS